MLGDKKAKDLTARFRDLKKEVEELAKDFKESGLITKFYLNRIMTKEEKLFLRCTETGLLSHYIERGVN